MIATILLTRHHNKALSGLTKLVTGLGSTVVLDDLASELVAHMIIEETIFYPAIRTVDEPLVLEGYEEHALTELALKRLFQATLGSDVFRARATALKELVARHAVDEEDVLFPKVEKTLDRAQLETLGKRMEARFEELVAQGWERILPNGDGATTGDALVESTVTDGANS